MEQRYDIKGFDLVTDAVEVHLDMRPTAGRIQKAGNRLRVNVMNAMLPYMPLVTGNFQARTRAANTAMIGTDYMYAAAGPMGRYLYEGQVMVNAKTGKGPGVIPEVGPRYRKGTKLKATGRPLDTSKSNNWSPHWFDVAKARYLAEWIKAAQRDLEGR